MRRVAVAVLGLALLFAGAAAWWVRPRDRAPLVLAAASLQEAMIAAADAWAAQGHDRPILSFAGSSALARQIAAGAPADLFVSADRDWMDDVDRRGLVVPGTRADFLANHIVLVAPSRSDAPPIALGPGASLAAAIGAGRIAMADPDAVPAGKYGKAALEHLGLWDSVAPRVASAENVRAALALVERGAAAYGIVYATDARASGRVRVVGTFPADSHPPIRYPLARLTAATSPDAEPFRRFLVSPAGKAIFARFGFAPL